MFNKIINGKGIKSMGKKLKVILLIVLVVYWIWPLDFIPGNPIDDLIVTIAYAFVSRNRLKG